MNRLLSYALAFMFGIAVAMTMARCADASPEPLESWTLKRALSLPVYYEDQSPGGISELTTEKRHELEFLAAGIAQVAKRQAPLPQRQWAALLLTIGFHESTFSLRILAGHCRKHECDGGRARGLFQAHRLASMSDEMWARLVGIENLPVQVEQADELLRRHVRTCPGDVATSIITGYMGKRCGAESKEVAARLETFRRLSR